MGCIRSTVPVVPSPTTSVRLDPTTIALIDKLCERLGLSISAVLRLAVRRLAQREGIPLPTAEPPTNKGGRPRKKQ